MALCAAAALLLGAASPAAGVGLGVRGSWWAAVRRASPAAATAIAVDDEASLDLLLNPPRVLAAAAATHHASFAPNQKVKVQVPQEAIEETRKQMSSSCGRRFAAIMNGEGPPMSQFEAPKGQDEEKLYQGCAKIGGMVCSSEGQISKLVTKDGFSKAMSHKRQGPACVPAECVGDVDLKVFTAFMREQTFKSMPRLRGE